MTYNAANATEAVDSDEGGHVEELIECLDEIGVSRLQSVAMRGRLEVDERNTLTT